MISVRVCPVSGLLDIRRPRSRIFFCIFNSSFVTHSLHTLSLAAFLLSFSRLLIPVIRVSGHTIFKNFLFIRSFWQNALKAFLGLVTGARCCRPLCTKGWSRLQQLPKGNSYSHSHSILQRTGSDRYQFETRIVEQQAIIHSFVDYSL